jgi:nucleoid-associated protein YgaU
MLTKATIINQDKSGDPITVLFNPTEYSFSKSNNWAKVPMRKSNVPRSNFVGGNPTELKVQLFIDTFELGTNAKVHVEAITNLTKLEEFKDGQRPPRVMFGWGTFISFVSVITSVSYKYTMFRDDGTPVRATMDLTFQECEALKKGQESPPMGIAGYKVVIIKPGDTIDGIATSEYGDPKLWRFIADTNNLDDPKDLKIGRSLVIEDLAA